MENITETGCCPRFQPEGWHETEHNWTEKLFVKDSSCSFLHIPLNMGKMMTRLMGNIEAAGASPEAKDFIMLSHDPSPWKSDHLVNVTKEVPGMEHVRLSGRFLSKVYEGPYKDARKWCKDMEGYVTKKGLKTSKLYFFYTTCPKCAKVYGKNYVVGVAKVS